MQKIKPVYIIEHLEPSLWEWCMIEYEHISEIVGKDNLWFTNLKSEENKKRLAGFGKVFYESVRDMKLDPEKICVLDPEASETLEPLDSGIFEYYIFGGILGDYPPKKRTKKELTKFLPKCEQRNIGKEQMSTDNAVYTVKHIVEHGKAMNELEFVDDACVEINEFESVDLPYRYNSVKGEPLMSKKIVDYLKRKKGF